MPISMARHQVLATILHRSKVDRSCSADLVRTSGVLHQFVLSIAAIMPSLSERPLHSSGVPHVTNKIRLAAEAVVANHTGWTMLCRTIDADRVESMVDCAIRAPWQSGHMVALLMVVGGSDRSWSIAARRCMGGSGVLETAQGVQALMIKMSLDMGDQELLQ